MDALQIRYDTAENTVSSATLIATLVFLQGSVNEIDRATNTENTVVRIQPFERGSFIFQFLLDHVTTDTVAIASTILSTIDVKDIAEILIECIKIKIRTGLQKIDKTALTPDRTAIKTTDGPVVIGNNNTITVYNNPIIHDQMNRLGEALDRDSNIRKFEINDKDGKPLIYVARRDFYRLHNVENHEIITDKQLHRRALLQLYNIVFSRNKKWGFRYNKRLITAKIIDPLFLDKIDHGQIEFKNGDTIECDLRVYQTLNQDLGEFEDADYEIMQVFVFEHHPLSQGNLEM